jgi:hypothetical protein
MPKIAADGACFDGSGFKDCDGVSANKLLWGVGIKYVWGKANRYFFNFNQQERDKCITEQGSHVAVGDCASGGALQWGLSDGKLSAKNGKMCVARLADNSAVMTRCSDASEYISMDVPRVFSAEVKCEWYFHLVQFGYMCK